MRYGIVLSVVAASLALGGCIVVIEKGGDGVVVDTQRELSVEREVARDVRRELRRADSAIAYDVRDAVLADPDLRMADIRIAASGGTVRLRGVVASAELRDRAIDLAASVEGVERVDSSIELTDWN